MASTNKKITYKDKPWLKFYDKETKASLKYENITLPEYLNISSGKFPDRIALNFQGYSITFKELNKMVNSFAACLLGFGIGKGDSVAVLLPNLIQCVVAYFAVLRINAIAVMNNPLYSDRELEYQFNNSGSKALITIDLLGNRMIDLRPKTKIKQIIIASIGDYLPFPKSLLFPLIAKKRKLAADVKPADNIYKWKELIAKYPAQSLPVIDININSTAMYQYTGGTTGVTKAAILSHRNISKHVQQLGEWFKTLVNNHETMLSALPFFHVFGLATAMNLSIYAGWSNILIPKPQPESLLEAITKFKPTITPLVPTMFIGLLEHPDITKVDLSSIKLCVSGSAPVPVEVIKEFEAKTGAVIVEGFGLTEASPVTHVNPYHGIRKVGSIGLPISDTECRIVDLDKGTKDMPFGETGELLIRGPQVMKSYLKKPEETKYAIRKDGWLFTGDIAKMDEQGYFYIVDRKKDIILSGGYNVYPRDIEEVLFENPKVVEACAIGLPHQKRGEQVKVFIVLKEGQTATEKEIIDYCRGKMAAYKLPTMVEFRKELPKSNVGKVLRKELRTEEFAKINKKV
jgi:long-chain acyl-CoA synthetase